MDAKTIQPDFVVVGEARGSGCIVPMPRLSISVRAGEAKDAPFVDRLQKMHSHMVGWMPTKQIEGKIAAGHLVVAEDAQKNPVGYCISQDQYAGREDVGIVYQLNVLPLQQRHLIGATLIKSVFARAAYGCRLFCCWCAQDIQANYFWESLGFVPLAFRTGSRDKQRIHIFWQRRVREDDTTTPYWFPSQTKSGALREDRLVLPIPPGTHWRDAKPIILPGMQTDTPAALPPPRREKVPLKVPIAQSQPTAVPPGKVAVVSGSGIRYLDRADYAPPPAPAKPKRPPKPRAKNDPKLIAAVRELRDRFLEHINTQPLLPAGKYDVARVARALLVSGVPMSAPSANRESPALPAPPQAA